ncbi:MAG TPA: LysR family transcriptional regulator [Gemmatimonadales bacterium]|nr:LysR family transcriptional regulator [Gemmatimonadales bacterium]
MELNQVSYFINLAETLNFTAAARLSGVSQPSLTRAIRRLEEELGGPLIYRDGKNSRLTALGQGVEMEFRRMQVALRNMSQHSDNWALGRHRVLDIAVAPTVGPNAFTSFFLSALEQIPSVGIKIRALQSSEDTTEVLSGKYHACILPREPRPDRSWTCVPSSESASCLAAQLSDCLSCHLPAEASDWVYVRGYPSLKQ